MGRDTHTVQLVDLDGQSTDAKWRSPNGQLPKVDEVIEVDGSGARARVTHISPDDETPIRAQLLAAVDEMIRTGRRKDLCITSERKTELAERLEAAGHAEAASTLRDRNTFPDRSKPAVLGVLNEWLDEAKDPSLAEELADLRHELDAAISEDR